MQVFANNVTVFVNQLASSVATEITLDSTASLPVITGDQFFTLTFFKSIAGIESDWEIVKVTAINGNKITCARGFDGTTQREWIPGSAGQMRVSRAGLADIVTKADGALQAAALAAAGGAGLVGFQQSGAGAVQRTVQDELRDRVSVKNFGAKGDGVTDDTAAIQAAINSLPNGGIIFFSPSATPYMVNGNYQPTFNQYGGIKPRSNQALILDGAELKAIPTAQGESSVINLYDVKNVRIQGGKVTGEKSTHLGSTGEWGHCISLWTAENVTIDGVEVSNAWGDCFLVGSSRANPNTYSNGVRIKNCYIHDGRRQGISIVAGINVSISRNRIEDIVGVSPQGCIDLEPDSSAYPNKNITISSNRLVNGNVGIYVTVGNQNVVVDGNDIDGRSYSMVIGDNTQNLRVLGNRLKSATINSTGGLAAIANNYSTIDGVVIASNQFDGSTGGFFLLDFAVGGYKNLSVRNNEFKVSAANVRAARLQLGVFQNNTISFSGSGGVNNDYFANLSQCTLGGNSYDNTTANVMYSLINNVIEPYPDFYASVNMNRGSIGGATGITSEAVKCGTISSGGGVANGGTYAGSVTGFDATKYDIVVNAYGGGENAASVGNVARSTPAKTASGFTTTLTNNGGATQLVYADWVAVRRG